MSTSSNKSTLLGMTAEEIHRHQHVGATYIGPEDPWHGERLGMFPMPNRRRTGVHLGQGQTLDSAIFSAAWPLTSDQNGSRAVPMDPNGLESNGNVSLLRQTEFNNPNPLSRTTIRPLPQPLYINPVTQIPVPTDPDDLTQHFLSLELAKLKTRLAEIEATKSRNGQLNVPSESQQPGRVSSAGALPSHVANSGVALTSNIDPATMLQSRTLNPLPLPSVSTTYLDPTTITSSQSGQLIYLSIAPGSGQLSVVPTSGPSNPGLTLRSFGPMSILASPPSPPSNPIPPAMFPAPGSPSMTADFPHDLNLEALLSIMSGADDTPYLAPGPSNETIPGPVQDRGCARSKTRLRPGGRIRPLVSRVCRCGSSSAQGITL